MTHQELLAEILEQEQADKIIPFLKSLTDKERKALVPEIKKARKKYSEFVPKGNNSYGAVGTPAQFKILKICVFICSDINEAKKLRYWDVPVATTIDQLVEWYSPAWFSDYVNRTVNEEYVGYSYKEIMNWSEKGLVSPIPELIAKILPQVIYKAERTGNSNFYHFTPQALEEYPITLQTHIWYLFNYENPINWTGGYGLQKKDMQPNASWIGIFKTFTADKKLERLCVLKESLLAVNRNFNKTLTGWFVDLFIAMEPTESELLELQNELFGTLNSPQSKPVNNTLKLFAGICNSADFNYNEFIGNLPLLLSSETKSIVISALSIADKISKKLPDSREEICVHVCNAFLSKDETIQSKASKIIQQYGNFESVKLKETLSAFTDSLLVNTKKVLQSFLADRQVNIHATVVENKQVVKVESLINSYNAIPTVNTIDELIFLASQAFDNNESYHIDLLPAALIKFNADLTAENIIQLEPAFQRAYKLVMSGGISTTGLFDNLLAIFFIDFGIFLKSRFENELKNVIKLHEKSKKEDEEGRKNWTWYKNHLCSLKKWNTEQSAQSYIPMRQVLLTGLQKINSDNKLPLLSTPTHTPAWIDPCILIDRLTGYQKNGYKPDNMDFQLALSRCALDNTETALQLAKNKLSGEYKELISFLLDKDAKPKAPFSEPAIWMTAALTKTPEKTYAEFESFSFAKIPRPYLNGLFKWNTINETYLAYGNYNSAKKGYDRYKDIRQTIIVENQKGYDSSIDNTQLLCEHFIHTSKIRETDLSRAILHLPNNPAPILADVVARHMNSALYNEVTERNTVTAGIKTLDKLTIPFNEIIYLFMGTCMLNADKTIRAYAAEVWIDRVNKQTIASKEIGKVIGIHEKIEWGPLKRFTDLVISNMMNISKQHDLELEELFTACLLQLDEPIKDLKKLLEIYFELLSINQSKIDNDINIKLTKWMENTTLKKACKQLLSLNK